MQKEQANDLELNLKKRARRRLVGAIALVLLMIIVLPMVLKDRAATPPTEEITISLPSDSGLPQDNTRAATDFDSTIVPTEPAASNSPPELAIDNNSQVQIPDPEASKSTTQTEVKKPQQTAEISSQTPVKNTTKPATIPASIPADKLASNGKFYVQIGVFSDIANVKQLQAKLGDLGYKSQTSKIDTDKGVKTRLRTEIFNNRNEAAIALQNIKDAGLTGMVVSQ